MEALDLFLNNHFNESLDKLQPRCEQVILPLQFCHSWMHFTQEKTW